MVKSRASAPRPWAAAQNADQLSSPRSARYDGRRLPRKAAMKLLFLTVAILASSVASADIIGGFKQRGGVHDRPPRHSPQDNYRIQRGDRLRVVLYEVAGPNEETAREVRVDRDGTIKLPLIDRPVRAADRTIRELEVAIHDAYRDAKLVHDVGLRVELIERPTTRPSK